MKHQEEQSDWSYMMMIKCKLKHYKLDADRRL